MVESSWYGRVTGAVALTAVLISGCSRDNPPDPVSPVDLQNALAARLAQAKTPAIWVNCPTPLASQLGATTRCDVTFNDTDSVTALLTTTGVDRGTAEWEITEAQLTKDQLVKRVLAATGAKNVDCDSGMDGQVGNWVPCHTTKNGVTLNQTAELTEVKGLSLKLSVTQFMPLQQVEDRVEAKLTPLYGRRPDVVDCNEDLPGIPGRSIDCVAVVDDRPDDWAVTVRSIIDGDIEFDVDPVVAPEDSQPR